MKREIILFTFLIIYTAAFAQKVQSISDVPPIKKGVLITNDGGKIVFQDLQVVKDTVIFKENDHNIMKIPGKDIYKISKTGNNAVNGVISGGLAGLLAGIAKLLVGNNEYLKINEGTYLIFTTAVGSLTGAIIGAIIPKDISIYQNTSTLSFSPDISINHNRIYASLGIKIKW